MTSALSDAAKLAQQSRKTWLWLVLGSIVLADIASVAVNDYIQLLIVYCAINVLLAVGLNLVNGFTGQFSLGHAGFMAVGAYASAWLSMNFSVFHGALQFLNFPLYAAFGGALAGTAGYVVGLPSLRLKGDYLAIVTLGFGEIIRVLLFNVNAVGGARGLYGIPTMESIQLEFGDYLFEASSFFLNCTLTLMWAAAAVVLLARLIQSSHGRTFLGVRDDEIASEAMGINTTQAKVRAFVISSVLAGIAGSIFAHTTTYLNPSSFSFNKSVDVVIMVVLGGMGSISGSVVAAVFVTLLPELLRPLQELTGVDVRMIVYSVFLIVAMIVRPEGLFGSREITDLWRARVRK